MQNNNGFLYFSNSKNTKNKVSNELLSKSNNPIPIETNIKGKIENLNENIKKEKEKESIKNNQLKIYLTNIYDDNHLTRNILNKINRTDNEILDQFIEEKMYYQINNTGDRKILYYNYLDPQELGYDTTNKKVIQQMYIIMTEPKYILHTKNKKEIMKNINNNDPRLKSSILIKDLVKLNYNRNFLGNKK
jgi:hypothetical protein